MCIHLFTVHLYNSPGDTNLCIHTSPGVPETKTLGDLDGPASV